MIPVTSISNQRARNRRQGAGGVSFHAASVDGSREIETVLGEWGKRSLDLLAVTVGWMSAALRRGEVCDTRSAIDIPECAAFSSCTTDSYDRHSLVPSLATCVSP